jgi:hypothetical protein
MPPLAPVLPSAAPTPPSSGQEQSARVTDVVLCRGRDLALCLSLANLCYLNAWEAVQSLEAADGQYFQKFPFLGILFVTTAGALLLALLFSL